MLRHLSPFLRRSNLSDNLYMADIASRHDPSPLWQRHQSFAQFVLCANAKGIDVPDDLVIVISVDLFAYMRRYYHVENFSVRGCEVIFESRCPTEKIHFLSRADYDSAKRHPEYWR